MAFSYNEVGPVDPGFTTVTLTFPFLDRVHVEVSVDKIVLPGSAWVWNSDSQIELNDPLVGGEVVKAFRTTPAEGVQADFQPGAFDYEELNTSLLHLLYIVQEAYDNSSVAVDAGNNAFTYLLQIEDLVDDAEIIFADMQGLDAGFSASVTEALADLGSALTASQLALAEGRDDHLASLDASLLAATTAITAARNSAVTAVTPLVVQAEEARDDAETEANRATLRATEAGVSSALAQKWASEAENVPVTTGPSLYSAFHWAMKAAASAGITLAQWVGAVQAFATKSTPINADQFGYVQASDGTGRKTTWGDIKTALNLLYARYDTAQSITQAQKGQHAANVGQAWEMIGLPIVPGVAVPNIEWLGLSAYRMLRLTMTCAPVADGQFLKAQWGAGGYQTAGYRRQYFQSTGSTAVSSLQASGAGADLSSDIGNDSSSRNATVIAHFFNFNNGDVGKWLCSYGGLTNGGGDSAGQISGLAGAVASDRLRVFFGTGNIKAGGHFVLEGLRG